MSDQWKWPYMAQFARHDADMCRLGTDLKQMIHLQKNI